ncbi:Hypothetical predicted protein, partial [Pelobates cultripes]
EQESRAAQATKRVMCRRKFTIFWVYSVQHTEDSWTHHRLHGLCSDITACTR